MIGYTIDDRITITFSQGIVSEPLTADVIAFSNTYLPDYPTERSSACCSDQQSYQLFGFPSVSLFETPTTSVVYPPYHTVGDTYDNGLINYEQVYVQGQAIFASVLEYAGVN